MHISQGYVIFVEQIKTLYIMTLYLTNIKGSIEEMNTLFDDAQNFSVRYFCPNNKNTNNFDITIRCNEEVAKLIKRKRSIKSLIKHA